MEFLCQCPKRLFLERVVREHEGALVYDLRRINVDPNTVDYEELFLLATYLMKDSTSWLAAEMSEWEYPVSGEWLILANIHDIHMAVNSKDKHTYPRPWTKERAVATRPDAREILKKAKEGNLEWQNKPMPT